MRERYYAPRATVRDNEDFKVENGQMRARCGRCSRFTTEMHHERRGDQYVSEASRIVVWCDSCHAREEYALNDYPGLIEAARNLRHATMEAL